MPWKSSAGGAIRRPRTWSKSIRGQISNPIPIVDPLDNNLFTTDRPSNNIEAEQHVIVDDADTVSRQSPESRDQIGTRYTSESSRTTDHCTLESQLPDAPSSLAARTSISQPSSADDRKDERGGQCQAHQRKKSVIRTALGRLFGRRNKVLRPKHGFALHLPSGRTDSDEPDDDGPPNQHSSDPYGQRPPTCHSALDSKRSFSMPITEYDRALRSHSIGPEDVMAIQSARNSLSADFRLSEKCTSLLDPATHHHESNRWTCGSRLGGLSPRPASSHGRTSKENANDDSNEIGRAIFSDAQGLKRRSRSLIFTPCSDVTSASTPPRGKARRRSAEIRYWRDGYAAPLISPVADEEYMHLPMQGTGKLETQLETELEQEFELEEQQPLRPQLQPEPQPVRTLGLSSSPKERTVTPPRPATMSHREEEEKRETNRSKSPARSVDSTGPGWADPSAYERQASDLETRMSRLENKVLQLGNSLSVLRQQSIERRLSGSRQLHGQNSNREIHSMLLQSSDMSFVGHGRYSVNRLSTCHSNTSKTTFGELGEVTPRATILSPMVPSHQRQRHAVEDTRPSSGNITSEQYASLLALLESERLARGALEAQVRSLGDQMHLMSKSVTYTTSTDQSDSPSLNRTTSLGEGSVWNHDEEDDRQLIAPRYPFNPQSLDESGIAAEIPLYDEYTEAFVTPAETAETVELAIRGLDAFGSRHKEVKSPSSTNTNKTFPSARDL